MDPDYPLLARLNNIEFESGQVFLLFMTPVVFTVQFIGVVSTKALVKI